MKKTVKPDLLPLEVLLLAVLGGFLRHSLYRVGLDEKNLLAEGHPLELALWLCTAVAGAVICFGTLRQKQPHSPSPLPAALGHILGAAGILLTVLLNGERVLSPLVPVWKYVGILASLVLLYAAFAIVLGKRPFFGAYAVTSVFFALHLVGHYKSWCSNPQLQDYVFAFGAAMALMVFAYQCAAAILNRGSDRALRISGGLAAYFCLVAISNTEYLYLHLGCALWAMCCLYRLGKETAADGAT